MKKAEKRQRLVVIDTNCLLQMLGRHSAYRPLWDAFMRSPNILRKDPYCQFRLIEQDPDDNKFVDCAIVSGADYIVSEDAHFRVLDSIQFPKINVIRLEDFMADLEL